MIDWNYWRGQMHLDPGIINLNTGSFGPSPKPVFERVTELRLMLAAEPTHFFLRQAPDLLWEARRRLAEFLHVSPIRLVFANNVSSAINLVANGLPLHSPGEIPAFGSRIWGNALVLGTCCPPSGVDIANIPASQSCNRS